MGPKNGSASNNNIDYEDSDDPDISDNIDLNNVKLNTLSASEQEKEGIYIYLYVVGYVFHYTN